MGRRHSETRAAVTAALLLAALSVTSTSAAQTAPREGPAPPTAAIEAHAQQLYQIGRERFRAEDFEGARAAFAASLDVVDSPNTRMYLGRSLQHLGRNAEAWSMLDRAASDAAARAEAEPRYAATRDSARAEADALAPSVARLVVEVTPAPADVTVRVNGHPIQRALLGASLPMDPGEARVEVSAPGFRGSTESVTLAAGASRTVALAMAALPPPRPRAPRALNPVTPPARTSPWRVAGVVTAAAGVATLAVGVGFALVAQGDYDVLRARGSGDDAQVDEGIFHRDLGNALMFVGATAAVSGVLLWWVTGRAPTETRAGPSLSVGPRGLSVGGSF